MTLSFGLILFIPSIKHHTVHQPSHRPAELCPIQRVTSSIWSQDSPPRLPEATPSATKSNSEEEPRNQFAHIGSRATRLVLFQVFAPIDAPHCGKSMYIWTGSVESTHAPYTAS